MSVRAATFRVDVTPPIGMALCGGMLDPAAEIAQTLSMRGLVLDEDGQRRVIAAVDFCYIVGSSQTRIEEALARGAGCGVDDVVIQSNHTHMGPLVAEDIHATIARHRPEVQFHDEAWWSDLLARAESTVAEAIGKQSFALGGVAVASHPVHEFASSRRVPDGAGGIHVRWSFCRTPHIKQAPVGVIDPALDLILLSDDSGQARAALTFYASHPQVGIIPGLVHGDSIGVALRLFEAAHPGVELIHFDGCGGDITAGKYTSGPAEREVLVFGVKLYDAIHEAMVKARPQPVTDMEWRTERFDCPLAPVHCAADHYRALLDAPETSGGSRYLYAHKLNRLEGDVQTYPFRLTHWRVNGHGAVFLPAELVVDYQLYAKAQYRGTLAVAAYGDSYLDYVGTDIMFEEGGYEVDPEWTEIGPGIEGHIKSALDRILADR